MKNFITLIRLPFAISAAGQQTFNQEPLILADSANADVGIGSTWYNGRWRISPEVPHDTLQVPLYGATQYIAFRTNRDSIGFTMTPGKSSSFYIKVANQPPAHTVITATPFAWDHITYGETPQRRDVQFFYERSSNVYYDSLRASYPISNVYDGDKTDQERVLSIMNWVHYRWVHNGGNSPKGNDGISILNEAKAGGRFPCFAYAIVLRDQLTASGFTARVLYLKIKDAKTSEGSPGHVVTEVYLKDKRKWVFIDGQFNVMPLLNGKPLNAVEFQAALSDHYDEVTLASRDRVSKSDYTDFVYSYLYYFSTSLDNRLLPAGERYKVDGKREIMLVPDGAPNLTKMKFFDTRIDNAIYTHSAADFYAQPK